MFECIVFGIKKIWDRSLRAISPLSMLCVSVNILSSSTFFKHPIWKRAGLLRKLRSCRTRAHYPRAYLHEPCSTLQPLRPASQPLLRPSCSIDWMWRACRTLCSQQQRVPGRGWPANRRATASPRRSISCRWLSRFSDRPGAAGDARGRHGQGQPRWKARLGSGGPPRRLKCSRGGAEGPIRPGITSAAPMHPCGPSRMWSACKCRSEASWR